MNRRHHSDVPFSSLPAISQCACYVARASGEEEESDATHGEELHEVCFHLAQGKDLPPEITERVEKADIEDCEATVAEAMAFVRDNVPGAELVFEDKVELFDDAGDRVSYGHCDVHGHNEAAVAVVDWKSGFDFKIEQHYYRPQLLGYALCDMRRHKLQKAFCIEAYIKPRKLRHYSTTYQEASGIVGATIAKRRDPERQPRPCDACALCGAVLQCPAVCERMATGAVLFTVNNDEMFAAVQNPGAVTTPLLLSRLLTFVRRDGKAYLKAVERMFDEVEEAALERSKAVDLPGYNRVLKPAKKELPPSAFERAVTLSGLPPQKFMLGLRASLPELAKQYAALMALPEKMARKELEGRLDALLKAGDPTPVLERQTDEDIAVLAKRTRAIEYAD